MSEQQQVQEQDKSLLTYDFNVIRLLDKDAIRIKQDKIPEFSASKTIHNVMGNVNRRKQKKHSYFSARAAIFLIGIAFMFVESVMSGMFPMS